MSGSPERHHVMMDEHILFLYSSEITQHFVSCRVRNNRPLRNRLVYNWCVVAQWEVLTEHFSLTRLWTIFILCVRRWMMTPAISTTFSSCSWSRTQSMAIRVPVLPILALCGHSVGKGPGKTWEERHNVQDKHTPT